MRAGSVIGWISLWTSMPCRWGNGAWGSRPAVPSGLALVDEALAASKPFVPSLQPRLNGLDKSVRDF